MYRIVCVSDEEIPKVIWKDLVLVQLWRPLTDLFTLCWNRFGPNMKLFFGSQWGRFDSHFVMQYFIEWSYKPTTGDDRLKIYDISVNERPQSTTFSWQLSCFCKHPLIVWRRLSIYKWMIRCFSHTCSGRRENMHNNSRVLPPLEDYIPSSMNLEKHVKFMVV